MNYDIIDNPGTTPGVIVSEKKDADAEKLRKYIRPIKIGGLALENNIFLAPLAGVTDRAFRVICKECGAGFVYSEMISAKGVHYGSKASVELAELDAREKPAAVQIFGSEPEIMAEAARVFEGMGAAAIDINMGCPVPKVVGNREGSALMRTPELAGQIVKAVADAVRIPVTVKMRRGFKHPDENAPLIARIAEQNGAAAVAVHGRYREEYYSGKCDRDVIRKVKESVGIPVIASGDVTCTADALAMFEETGCDGIMIGRGALGNPWLFTELTDDVTVEKTDRLVFDTIMSQLREEVEFKGEDIGVKEMRKHIAWYLKGRHGAAALKNAVFKAETCRDIMDILESRLLSDE